MHRAAPSSLRPIHGRLGVSHHERLIILGRAVQEEALVTKILLVYLLPDVFVGDFEADVAPARTLSIRNILLSFFISLLLFETRIFTGALFHQFYFIVLL